MSFRRASFILLGLTIISSALGDGLNSKAFAESGKLVYVTDGLDLPFWRYVAVGVSDVAKTNGFGYAALDSHHDAQTQMQNTQDALAKDTTGIVLSPTDSTSAPTFSAWLRRAMCQSLSPASARYPEPTQAW